MDILYFFTPKDKKEEEKLVISPLQPIVEEKC